jgi:rhamnosyl/mannosyltransferase
MEFGEQVSGEMSHQKPDLSDFDLTALSVGRFAYYKGFEYLVAAAEKAPRVRFHIVGDGPEYLAIKQLIAEKRLENQVRLFGSVDRQTLIHLFRSCDVFCLPSIERTEAFGLVLLEAMYFEKPLITTKLAGSGVTTVNRHGETGLHVPPGNPDALADAILFLEKNVEIRKEMGRRAHQRFLDAFHIESVSGEIGKILKSL